MTWFDAVYKRLIDGVKGLGGIEAFVQFMDQVDFIPELAPLRMRMKLHSIFFETALAKCNKEMLKRPRGVRSSEALKLMGSVCRNCRREMTFMMMESSGGICKQCGGVLEPSYVVRMEELLAEGVSPNPEAILMDMAYDNIAEAYVATFEAFQLVLSKTATMFNQEHFALNNPRLKNYLDNFFLGRMTGENKIPREEKETLQFIIRANLASVPLGDAAKMIRLSMKVVKYGYMYEVLGCNDAYPLYQQVLAEAAPFYDEINTKIREELGASGQESKRTTVEIIRTIEGMYPPCLLMPRSDWESGSISKELQLVPMYKMPFYPKVDFAPIQFICARMGSGKTFLMSAINSFSIESKQELIFQPMADKSNSFTLASLPMFEYDNRTSKLLKHLKEKLLVEPHGIPVLTLTILQKGDRILDIEKNPPTKFDRVVEIDDPKGFDLNFNEIVETLREIAEGYGNNRPTGIITIRNMDRYYGKQNINIDIEIGTTTLGIFDGWKKSHLKYSARVQIDELSYFAPSQVTVYGSDALRSGATFSDFIKESRRNNTSVDGSTQLPLEISPEIRNQSTNIFFRDLSTNKDKNRSHIDFVLESLQLKDPAVKKVILDINNRGLLPPHYWFWYNQSTKEIQVIQPCPPVFCLQDPEKPPKKVFEKYEKLFPGEKILLDSWKDVPRIIAGKTEKKMLNDEVA